MMSKQALLSFVVQVVADQAACTLGPSWGGRQGGAAPAVHGGLWGSRTRSPPDLWLTDVRSGLVSVWREESQ